VRPAVTAVVLILVLLLADAAVANDESVRVNEIDPREGFVELLDLSPPENPFFFSDAYAVRSYDGAGNEVAAQEYPTPVPFTPRTPFVLSIALPAGGGQVCFERQRNPESTLPFEEYRLHCMGYGEVTKPAMRRLQLGPRRLPMPVAPFPPPGESVQRQPCGKAAVARSTRGAENVDVPAACAGEPTACDDPRKADVATPRLVVKLPRVHDVDRPLVMKVTMNEPGDFSFRGSVAVGRPRPGRTFLFGPFQRELRANVPVRIRITIPPRFKPMIKRAARRGIETRGGYAGVGRDKACFKNRFHSSRSFTLVP
jgi:hypothetical protein